MNSVVPICKQLVQALRVSRTFGPGQPLVTHFKRGSPFCPATKTEATLLADNRMYMLLHAYCYARLHTLGGWMSSAYVFLTK